MENPTNTISFKIYRVHAKIILRIEHAYGYDESCNYKGENKKGKNYL